MAAWFVATNAAISEDTVIARSAGKPAAEVRRTGAILDYTGAELRLRTTLGRDEIIPASRVIEIQTTWIAPHAAARAARVAGKLTDAIASFEQAKAEERRPWAQRQIAAELSGTWLEAGNVGRAGDEFLAIVAADPSTLHFETIPVAWQAMALDAQSEKRAAAWLADEKNPFARLLGASWLIGSSRQAHVQAALTPLAESKSRHLAGLARIQLWRTRLPTASTGELDQWAVELAALPREIQAAGWYVLGDGYARHDDGQRAAIAYLKPPLVFQEQRALAADGLLAAARQLEKLGKADEATVLYREIVRDLAHLPAAEEAREAIADRGEK